MREDLKYLMDEYEQLGQQAYVNQAAHEQILGGALSQLKEARNQRMSPNMAFMWGAMNGSFRPDTTAAGESMKAYNAATALQEKDPLVDYEMLGGYLGEQGKQMNDLRKKLVDRMISKESQMGKMFETKVIAPGVALMTNGYTGSAQTIAVDDVNQFRQQFNIHYKTMIEGGVTDTLKAQSEAWEMAFNDMEVAKQHGRNIPGMAPASLANPNVARPSISPSGEPIPESSGEQYIDSAGRPTSRENSAARVRGNEQQRNLAEIDKELANPRLDPKSKAILQAERQKVLAGTSAGNIIETRSSTPTPQQSVQLLTKPQIEQYAKENAEDKTKLDSLRQMSKSMDVMTQILNSGKNTSGPAHEFFNKLGGYISYIDPENSLSKAAGNDAMYYSNMMNLVRDKIKALGAGTAVSNLDLIVTQKSVGDLRNTPEGNKKIMAIMALQNATMENKLTGKLDYFNRTNNYRDYRGDSSATHIVRRSPTTGEYWIQSKGDWINEQIKAGRVKTPEEAAKYFEQEAIKSTANLIKGTGISMGGQ